MYEPTVWATGDVVTAEKLNKLENGVASGGVYTESETVRFSGEVTTAESYGDFMASLPGCDLSDAPDQITVVFDGTEYTVNATLADDIVCYGVYSEESGVDFSQYPFFINAFTETSRTVFSTETAGTHSVVIKSVTKTVNSELQAVLPLRAVVGTTTLAELEEAWGSGRLVYCIENGANIYFLLSHVNSEIVTYPDVQQFIIEDGVLENDVQ